MPLKGREETFGVEGWGGGWLRFGKESQTLWGRKEFNHCFILCKRGKIIESFALIFSNFKRLYILYPRAKGQNICSNDFLWLLVLPEKFLQT